MEFRRIEGLPPYVFSHINDLKLQARRDGIDVIDFGFGNPDVPSPDVAVEKMAEAVRNPRNHRYSSSRGLPKLRGAVCDMYLRKFGVELDPETNVVSTIGAKEGLSHLMWVLVSAGDTAIVPTPSYPIHQYAPLFAGAHVEQVPLRSEGEDHFLEGVIETFERTWPRPRVIVLSFPHNPTNACVDLEWMHQVIEFARANDVVVVHDFAYADVSFDGYKPPSILQVPGAMDCAVELYSMTKGFSMAGWRLAFMVGNPEIVAALTKLKSYLDYGAFQPIQIASIVAMNEAPDYPDEVAAVYQSRRDVLCEGLNRIGWAVDKPQATMFVWAPIPAPYQEMGSLEFAKFLITEGEVATSPGVGFGPGGEGYIRFALIENEQRTAQALRNLRRALPKL